jgi:hypothetical protein
MECGAPRARTQARPEGSTDGMAEQWMHEGVELDQQKLLPPKGFVLLPRR